MTQILSAQFSQIAIRAEGNRVLVIRNGKAILDMPWDAALTFSKAVRIKALEAEEIGKVESLVFDQAILTRMGVPFGLTNNGAILKEATKEAAWNSDLRRYIRGKRAGGLESQAVVGTPNIIRTNPK
jgi:hypothetical protein